MPRDDVIARVEARGRAGLAEVRALGERTHHAGLQIGIGVRRRRVAPRGQVGHATLQLLARDHAFLDQQPHVAIEPALVVARGQVVARRHPLDRVTALVDVEDPLDAAGAREAEHPALPARVEDGLVRLGLDGPESVHAAHVVDAVHTLMDSLIAKAG